jgi:hypothetical protein
MYVYQWHEDIGQQDVLHYCSCTVADAAGAVGGGVCSNFFSPSASIPLAHADAAPFSAPCNWAPLFRQVLCPLSPLQAAGRPGESTKGWHAHSLSSSCCAADIQHRAAGGKGCAAGPRATTWMLSVRVCVSTPGTPPSTCAAATCLSRLAGTPCLCY